MEINFIEIYEMALNSNQGNRGNQFIDSYNNSDVGDFFNYRSGTVNSNTVNSKFHLIRSFFEIFARFLSFHV